MTYTKRLLHTTKGYNLHQRTLKYMYQNYPFQSPYKNLPKLGFRYGMQIYHLATLNRIPQQGCRMVCFQISNLGKLWRVYQGKILVYFMTILSILWPLEIFYGHLVYFVVVWYISPRFGILYQEKSGNPVPQQKPQTKENSLHSLPRNKLIQTCKGGRVFSKSAESSFPISKIAPKSFFWRENFAG
jgi:hypothetical protein